MLPFLSTFCLAALSLRLVPFPGFHICFVCQMTAVDDDADENGLLRYTIISVSPDATGMVGIGGFEMDVNTGTVRTTGSFDREMFAGPYSIAVSVSLPPSLTPSLTHSLTPSLPHSLPHSLTPSLTHSLPRYWYKTVEFLVAMAVPDSSSTSQTSMTTTLSSVQVIPSSCLSTR